MITFGRVAASVRFRCAYALRALARHTIGRPLISAMVRVKDEEEFLHAAVSSIVDCVDEVVLIDNLSSDASPEIMERLRREHPSKVVLRSYPYSIRRVGHENRTLSIENGNAPHLSSAYYNWCLRQCRHPYVLKWDADMVALPGLGARLQQWRASRKPIMTLYGANVHPDRQHLLAARISDREVLEKKLGDAGIPKWVASLTHDAPEPRLFPKRFARYRNRVGWTQSLESPFYDARFKTRFRFRVQEPAYLHLKFCKRHPCANYSPDLAALIAGNVGVGPPLEPASRETLVRWGLAREDT